MPHTTLKFISTQAARLALRWHRRRLERAIEHGWNVEASRQLDACLLLEESLNVTQPDCWSAAQEGRVA